MRKALLFATLLTFSGCYFGMNEDSGKIVRDFYLISWDGKFHQISRSKNSSEFNSENIIIRHDVFAVGHNKNFIIAAQHPCENRKHHLTDYSSEYTVNKEITNYYIIELLNGDDYVVNMFDNLAEYQQGRIDLKVPKDLKYLFEMED